MAAPVPGTRSARVPAGIKLDDGYQTLVQFAAKPTIGLWEIGVTPPGYDGGDPIDTTTMHNEVWRSMAARSLITMTPFECRFAYDPLVFNDLLNLINVETTITVHFPDGSRLAFFGFEQNFEPDELAEGEFPEASVTITPTNADPTTGAEEDPVYVNVVGT